jgi:hypothetical protein
MITNSEFKTSYNEISDNLPKYFPQVALLTPQTSVLEETKSDLSKEGFDLSLELSNLREKNDEESKESHRSRK